MHRRHAPKTCIEDMHRRHATTACYDACFGAYEAGMIERCRLPWWYCRMRYSRYLDKTDLAESSRAAMAGTKQTPRWVPVIAARVDSLLKDPPHTTSVCTVRYSTRAAMAGVKPRQNPSIKRDNVIPGQSFHACCLDVSFTIVERRYAILDVQTTELTINRQVSQIKRPVFHNLKLLYSPTTVPTGVWIVPRFAGERGTIIQRGDMQCFTVTLTSTTTLTGSKLDLSSTMTATARAKTSFISYVMCPEARF
jgi:hypothetical protein